MHENSQELLNSMLNDLVDPDGYDISAWAGLQDSADRERIWQDLQSRGYVEKKPDNELRSLSPLGFEVVRIGVHLRGPERALKIRDEVPMEEYTVWELIRYLDFA